MDQVDRPALCWNLRDHGPGDILVDGEWPTAVNGSSSWSGATGRGVRVCVIDSGVERHHPLVGSVEGTYEVVVGVDGAAEVRPTDTGDNCGHGTACAGIIRSVAPECELYSVSVLDRNFAGTGDALLCGLRWAIEQRYDVINLSLSTNHRRLAETLRVLADEAYFHGSLLVASAHNLPVESFPWRFASVISVGSHAENDPSLVIYNPTPPVEFFGHGTNVEVAWLNGGRRRCSGNSFAAPHITGQCALLRSVYPGLTPFQVKCLLYLTSANVRGV
jgi:subtilisin